MIIKKNNEITNEIPNIVHRNSIVSDGSSMHDKVYIMEYFHMKIEKVEPEIR